MSCDVNRIKLALNELVIFLTCSKLWIFWFCVNNGTMGRHSLDDSILCRIKIQILIASIIPFIVCTQFQCEFQRCWQSRYSRNEMRNFSHNFLYIFSPFLLAGRPQQEHDNNEWAKEKKEKWGKWNEQSKSFHSHWTSNVHFESQLKTPFNRYSTLLFLISYHFIKSRLFVSIELNFTQQRGKGK